MSNKVSLDAPHLHFFEIRGQKYCCNATSGHTFHLSGSSGDPGPGVTVSDLGRFGLLDAIGIEALDADPPPTSLGSVLLNVTHKCNLACAYCIMGMPDLRQSYQQSPVSMTPETGRACIDFLVGQGYGDQVSLTFFGGEPLLEFDVIRGVVEYAETISPGRFRYQLITNGCLMRAEMYPFFREHGFSFLWSLDGERATHDRLRRFKTGNQSVFSRSFTALQALREAWPECRFGINVTYFKQTLDLPAALRFFRGCGVEAIRMDRGLVPRDSPYAVDVHDAAKVAEMLSEMAEDYLSMLLGGEMFILNPFVNYMRIISKRIPRFRACNSGLDYVTISATGEVYPCYKLLGVEGCRLGDVESGFSREISLKKWDDMRLSKRIGCATCWARFICAGGCVADNRHLNDSYAVPVRENCVIFLRAIELSVHIFFTLMHSAPDTLAALLGDDHVSDAQRPRRREGMLRDVGGGHVGNAETGGVFRLNETAGEVFAMYDGNHSMAEISTHLAARYGLPPGLAELDCREQFFRMSRAGLLET